MDELNFYRPSVTLRFLLTDAIWLSFYPFCNKLINCTITPCVFYRLEALSYFAVGSSYCALSLLADMLENTRGSAKQHTSRDKLILYNSMSKIV